MRHFRLLLAALLACVFTSGAWAQSITSNGITYTVSSGNAYVSAVEASTTVLRISERVTISGTSYNVCGFLKTANAYTDLNCRTWKTLVFPSHFTQFENSLLYSQSGRKYVTSYLENLEVVYFIAGSELTIFPEELFMGCGNLREVTLPEGIQYLGTSCFENCTSLTTIINLGNVTGMGEQAFRRCTSLLQAEMPNVNEIPSSAFAGCTSLGLVSLGACKRIGDEAFNGCTSLTEMTFGNVLSFIGVSAFMHCGLTSISLPSTLEYIDELAFSGTGIQTIVTNGLVQVSSDFYSPSSAVTVTVPAGTATTYKKLAGWQGRQFTFVEVGEKTINVRASESVSGIELWSGNVQLGSIPKEGGELSLSVTLPQSLQLRVPTQYDQKINVDGRIIEFFDYSVVTPSDPAYAGYKFYTLNNLSGISNIEVKYGHIPDDTMLTAALVPSKGEFLMFSDGNISNFSDESRVCQFEKGSDVVITPHNMNKSFFGLHVYINGVERTEDLVDGSSGEQELHLQNVTEDLLVEAKYEVLKIDMKAFSTKGGTTIVTYTNVYDNTVNYTLTTEDLDRVYDMKPGTPVTFTFRPQAGYELGLVLCEYERPIFKGEGENSDFEVQLQSDGSYKFVLPAEQFNQINSSISVFYKQTGTNVDYDVNHDGEVNVSDVTALVNKILHP